MSFSAFIYSALGIQQDGTTAKRHTLLAFSRSVTVLLGSALLSRSSLYHYDTASESYVCFCTEHHTESAGMVLSCVFAIELNEWPFAATV